MTDRTERAYIVRLVTVLCAGWAVIYADRTVLYPLLTVIARDFGLSGVQTGLITGTYFTLYVMGQLSSGLLAERFGLKRMLVLYCLVAAVGVAGFGLAAVNYPALLAVAGLHGVGAGAYYPMAYSIMIHSVPGSFRGVASGVINGGMSLGLAAGLALAGPFYQATGSWRVPFLVLAIPTFLLALMYRSVLREVEIPTRRSESLWKLLRDPTLLCMNLAAFCALYGWWVILSWGPVFFQTERGLSLTLSGLYTLVIAVTAIPWADPGPTLRPDWPQADHPGNAAPHGAGPGCRGPGALPGRDADCPHGLWPRGETGLGSTWHRVAGRLHVRTRPEAGGRGRLFSFTSVMSAVVGPP
jgi:MFS family permease